jgi:hypothetical protein
LRRLAIWCAELKAGADEYEQISDDTKIHRASTFVCFEWSGLVLIFSDERALRAGGSHRSKHPTAPNRRSQQTLKAAAIRAGHFQRAPIRRKRQPMRRQKRAVRSKPTDRGL